MSTIAIYHTSIVENVASTVSIYLHVSAHPFSNPRLHVSKISIHFDETEFAATFDQLIWLYDQLLLSTQQTQKAVNLCSLLKQYTLTHIIDNRYITVLYLARGPICNFGVMSNEPRALVLILSAALTVTASGNNMPICETVIHSRVGAVV